MYCMGEGGGDGGGERDLITSEDGAIGGRRRAGLNFSCLVLMTYIYML
jgi:hypothetical protein